MRYAIVSDIHANRQAWESACLDMASQKLDATICLGDIVGYGPMPDRILDSVREQVDEFVMGNHDAAVAASTPSQLFGERALRSLEWTRAQLDSESISFLGELPLMIEIEDFAVAHAEVIEPGAFGYLDNPTDARLNFESNAYPLVFVGHTHVPEVYALREKCHTIQKTAAKDFVLESGVRYLVNAGSIGDPRDGSARACYCIYDDKRRTVEYRKLPFNLDEFKADMALKNLDDWPHFIWDAEASAAGKANEDWAMEMPTFPPKPSPPSSRDPQQGALGGKPARNPAAGCRSKSDHEHGSGAASSSKCAQRQQDEIRKKKIQECIRLRKQARKERNGG